jgi:hypothetical protein
MQVAQSIVDGARVSSDEKGQEMPQPDLLTQFLSGTKSNP